MRAILAFRGERGDALTRPDGRTKSPSCGRLKTMQYVMRNRFTICRESVSF